MHKRTKRLGVRKIASSVVWTLYRLSSQRAEGWESSFSGDTGIHTGLEWQRRILEDEAMKIGPWVARKRKAFWEARFAVAVANCNASMISRSQHITD